MQKILLLFLLAGGLLFAQVGTQAKDFTLQKHTGGNFTLSDYSGKVVYIFWFGNGCPSCKSNGSQNKTEVAAKYSANDFQAVGIDTWSGSTTSSVGSFQASTGITYPLLLNGASTAQAYGVTYDRSMVIDQNGVIQYYGSHDYNKINSIINNLLNPSSIKPEKGLPTKFGLESNYPNPFNPSTTIPFSVKENGSVSLKIYNVTGKLIKTLVNGSMSAGKYRAEWDGFDASGAAVASGVYFVRLASKGQRDLLRITLIK